MNIFFTCLLISISLSMDAFSLALLYGTNNIGKKNEIMLSIIVGLFHFFMPLLGLFFGNIIMNYIIIDINIVVGIIFSLIGLEMLFSKENNDLKILTNIFSYLFFGLSVSIDSLTTGIGLSAISNNYIMVSILFMTVSSLFTYLGLILGTKLNKKFGIYASKLGGIIMLILAINYILN